MTSHNWLEISLIMKRCLSDQDFNLSNQQNRITKETQSKRTFRRDNLVIPPEWWLWDNYRSTGSYSSDGTVRYPTVARTSWKVRLSFPGFCTNMFDECCYAPVQLSHWHCYWQWFSDSYDQQFLYSVLFRIFIPYSNHFELLGTRVVKNDELTKLET